MGPVGWYGAAAVLRARKHAMSCVVSAFMRRRPSPARLRSCCCRPVRSGPTSRCRRRRRAPAIRPRLTRRRRRRSMSPAAPRKGSMRAATFPAQWWTVFHSKELDGLIAEALQANPSLQAAQAALWQAKENLYAQRGKLLPTVDANGSATREQFSPAEFGGTGAPFIFNSVPGHCERLLRARRVRRPAAAGRGQRGDAPNISASSWKRPI